MLKYRSLGISKFVREKQVGHRVCCTYREDTVRLDASQLFRNYTVGLLGVLS